MKKIKPFHLSMIVIVAAVIAWLNPLGMEMSQRIILSGLIAAAGIWATEAIHKSISVHAPLWCPDDRADLCVVGMLLLPLVEIAGGIINNRWKTVGQRLYKGFDRFF